MKEFHSIKTSHGSINEKKNGCDELKILKFGTSVYTKEKWHLSKRPSSLLTKYLFRCESKYKPPTLELLEIKRNGEILKLFRR